MDVPKRNESLRKLTEQTVAAPHTPNINITMNIKLGRNTQTRN